MISALLFLMTSLGAGVAAFVGNRLLYKMAGSGAAIFAVPWWEEACKLGVSLMLYGLPVLGVHLVFGSLELAYDLFHLKRAGWFIGVYSATGHALYGWVATYAAERLVGTWPPYLLAVSVHLIVNAIAVTLLLPTFDVSEYAGAGEG